VLSQTPLPRDIGKPRLPVDRAFTLRGIGTVVTGTLTGGALRRGQAVLIQPAGRATRIRNLQTHSQDVEVAGSGIRTALNLPDLAVAAKRESAAGGEAVHRGEVVTLAELGTPSDTLDVLLARSPRLTGTKSGAARPLRDGTLVHVHHGSGHFPARVLLLAGGQIGPGEQGLAQLRCPEPVFAFVGDRFIVRDWSEQNTLGGGIVLDADADRRRFHTDAQKRLLAGRAQSPHDVTACIETQLERDRATRRSNLLVKSGFSAAEISHAVDRLASVGKTVLVGDLVTDAVWWQALQRRVADAIDAEHKKNPQHIGLPLNELRAILDSDLPSPELFQVLVNDLSRNGFVQAGVAIKRATHCPALPPQLQTAGAKLRTALAAKPFEPPSRKELAPDSLAQQALRFLRETGEVIELGDDVVLMSESFARMREEIVKFIRDKGPATVSDLRQVLGTTRRIMVPVLERLDRDGVTARQGEKRILRTH
jgi:selenocysteine-specific elongation factor